MTLLIAKVKKEVREILVVALFFSVGFCIIIVHNRLLASGSNIQIAGFAQAVIGGFIVAKALLTVDMLPFIHAFPHKPPVYNIGWKTSLYIVGTMVFFYMEPFLKNLIKGAGLSASYLRAWQELMLPRTWANVIWLAVLLVVFVTTQELGRMIGKDQLKHMFFRQRGKPLTETRSRRAA
jgi:hypothetical protein